MSDLWLRAANDRIAQIERIRQQRWPEVIAAYRKQFEGMAWAEMPQIQELLEYAQALETDGDSKNAVTQYRQVLRTDRENGTRQARIARERLQALGSRRVRRKQKNWEGHETGRTLRRPLLVLLLLGVMALSTLVTAEG